MRKILILIIVLVMFGAEVRAYDVATESTQIMNNIQLILSAVRQLESLYNEQTMIQNQIVQLQSVATYQNQWSGVNSNTSSITGLINQGISLSNQVESLLNQMQQAANGLTTNETASQETRQLGQGTMQIVQNSLNRVQQQRQQYQQEQDSVNQLLAKSNDAVGQTQAIQTLNQLVGQMILQMQMMRDLMGEQISLQSAAINEQNQEKQDQANASDQMYNAVGVGQSSFSFPQNWSTNGTN